MSDLSRANVYAMLFKKESTYGEDSGPTPGLNALQVIDGTSQTQSDTLERNLSKTFDSANPFARTNKRVALNGTVELVGAHTAGAVAPIGDLLECLGYATVLTEGVNPYTSYIPITDNISSGTAYFFHNRELIKAFGCRGRINTITGGINQILQANYEMLGFYEVSQSPPPTGVDDSRFDKPIAPTVNSFTVNLANSPLAVRAFTINGAGNVSVIEHSEGRQIVAYGRSVTGTLTAFLPSAADLDLRQLIEEEQHIPLEINQHFSNAVHKSARLTAPTIQLNDWTNSEFEGHRTIDIPFTVIGQESNQGITMDFGFQS